MDKEYEEGRQSYLTLRGGYQNPYPINSPGYNRFEAGWKQAAGWHPDLLREYQYQKNVEQRRAKELKDEEARRSAEAYRKAKGRQK